MPTVTARSVDVDVRSAAARVRIAEALRDAGLTPIQVAHLLSTMLTDYTRRLEALEAEQFDHVEGNPG